MEILNLLYYARLFYFCRSYRFMNLLHVTESTTICESLQHFMCIPVAALQIIMIWDFFLKIWTVNGYWVVEVGSPHFIMIFNKVRLVYKFFQSYYTNYLMRFNIKTFGAISSLLISMEDSTSIIIFGLSLGMGIRKSLFFSFWIFFFFGFGSDPEKLRKWPEDRTRNIPIQI